MTFSSAAVLLLVLLVSGSTAAASCPESADAGWWTFSIPWSCADPFDCNVEYCQCVDGALSSLCTPYGENVTVPQIEACAAHRVTCVLNAALRARLSAAVECRSWGDALTNAYYNLYYFSKMNLTASCVADMCDVFSQATSLDMALSVNYSRVCSLENFSWPVPIPAGVVPGCVVPHDDYLDFGDGAPSACITPCLRDMCVCNGGSWNGSSSVCVTPAGLMSATAKRCLGTAFSCAVNSALGYYVPGATPFNVDPCVRWSVGISADYSAYFSTPDKTKTQLWKNCNASACPYIFGSFFDANFSTTCELSDVSSRPLFIPYDPCPTQCPDDTCADSITGCSCVAKADIQSIDAVFHSVIVNGTFDASQTLSADAFAKFYGVDNCSDIDLSIFLDYRWALYVTSGQTIGSLATINSQSSTTLLIAERSQSSFHYQGLTVGRTYILSLTANGVVNRQVINRTWVFTAVAPPPQVSITRNGAEMWVSNIFPAVITAWVVDLDPSEAVFSWQCQSLSSGGCPTLVGMTVSSCTIASNGPPGTYRITYRYRNLYFDSISIVVVAGLIPNVKIVVVNPSLSTLPLAFLSTQGIILNSAVSNTAAPALQYTWKLNGQSVGKQSFLSINASDLIPTSWDDAQSKNYVWNSIALTVVDMSTSASGFATIRVVALAAATLSLNVSLDGVNKTVAQALSDKIMLTPSGGPVDSLSAPLSSSVVYTFAYHDTIGGVDVLLPLSSVPTGTNNTFSTTAPVISGSTSWQRIVFRVTLKLNGIVAGSASTSFNVTSPNLQAAISQQLSQAATVVDSSAAVSVCSTMRALLTTAAATNGATQAQQLAVATLNLIARSISNASSLTSEQQVAVFAAMTTALDTQSGSALASYSQQMSSIIVSALSGPNFDPSNAQITVSTIGALVPSVGASISVIASQVLSRDATLPIGESKQWSANGITIAVMRQSGSNVSGLTFSGGGGARLQIPSTFSSLPGVDDTTVFGIASATLEANPFSGPAGDSSVGPTGGVVTFDITVGDNYLPISNLAQGLLITLPATAAVTGTCGYIGSSSITDNTPVSWQFDGVTTITQGTSVVCETSHLTAFGSIVQSTSSASCDSFLRSSLFAIAVLLLVVY